MEPSITRPHMPDYGVQGPDEGTGLLPWSWAVERLTASHDYWVATTWPDGRPHVTPVGALWLDGAFWFQTGPMTKKARNVARDPRCSLAVSIRDADVVVEGDAERVTEPAALGRAAEAWAAQGWPAEVDDSGAGITAAFNAPAQGPPPWNVYRVKVRSAVVCWNQEPGGLTRFRF